MKLFFYYAFCSFKNQLKKLFKTWVLIFILACALIGGIIGVTVASFEDAFSENSSYEDVLPEDAITNDNLIEEYPETEPMPFEASALAEAIVSGVLLIVLFTNFISGDKNGSAIFLPADVNILFASPLKPQSVLMFRLACQMGASLVASIYILFQIPNLVMNLGMDIFGALSLIAVWFFMLVYSKLLSVFVYTVSSTYTKFKSLIRPIAYGFVGVLVLSFYAYHLKSGGNVLDNVVGFFTLSFSRYIPVYGWMKLFVIGAFERSLLKVIISFILLALGAVVFIAVIWKLKADFYEDAMQKSEELGERMRQAKERGFATKKKERSEKIKRDGEIRGEGANVFFHISLYNRKRFSYLGFFTKTNITYLLLSVLVSFCCIKFLNFNSAVPAALAIGAFAFYRSLGNPIQRDLSSKIFLSAPESMYKKMFYSHLGGSLNCLLDIIPSLLLLTVYFKENVIFALVSLIFIVSIDLYSGNVGAFIDVATPTATAQMIKSILQIMFIYFGLLPIIVIVALGFLFKMQTLFILLASLFAVACAGIFFFFAGMVLQKGRN